MEKTLRLKHIASSTHGSKIKDISFDLEGAQVHAILSSHMSTLEDLLDIFYRQTPLESGSILLGESDIFSLMPKQIGFVFKEEMLFTDKSIAENIYMTDESFGIFKKKFIGRKCERLFSQFNYNYSPMRLVGTLTYEQRKMVEIFRCFVQMPQLLILYETANSLSYENIARLNRMLEHMKQQGRMVLYFTSKWEDAIHVADMVTVITNGECRGTFSIDEIRKDPRHIYYLMLDGDNFMAIYQNGHGEEGPDLLQIINESSNFISSGYSINNTLNFFAQKVTDELQAAGCVIYLIDQVNSRILDTIEYQTDKQQCYLFGSQAIRDILENIEGVFFSNYTEQRFAEYFEQRNDAKTVLGFGIKLRNKISGFILVPYREYHVYSQNDLTYLMAVSKEIAVIIENSRLMGKSVLLQESHHRIKNNLQMIISLLQMQKAVLRSGSPGKTDALQVDEFIDTIANRIKSIASIHDLLSREDDVNSVINIRRIIQEIKSFYSASAVVSLDVDDVFIPHSRATSLSLIINELISNSVKHTDKQDHVRIAISFHASEGEVHFHYQDNGPGFPLGFVMEQCATVGMMVVCSIVHSEFDAQISTYNECGAHVHIAFPKKIFLYNYTNITESIDNQK